jgi:hypothetical protein
MSNLEIKQKLVSQIWNIENAALLNELLQLLDIEGEAEKIISLTSEQIAAIRSGQEDIKAGRFLTSDQADKETVEWLNE